MRLGSQEGERLFLGGSGGLLLLRAVGEVRC